jgi:DHA2 family multidrug resistance protein
MDALTRMFMAGDHAAAQSQAFQEINRHLQRQAELLSYVDDFRYMALACFCCVPLVWMLKRVKNAKAAAGAH